MAGRRAAKQRGSKAKEASRIKGTISTSECLSCLQAPTSGRIKYGERLKKRLLLHGAVTFHNTVQQQLFFVKKKQARPWGFVLPYNTADVSV